MFQFKYPITDVNQEQSCVFFRTDPGDLEAELFRKTFSRVFLAIYLRFFSPPAIVLFKSKNGTVSEIALKGLPHYGICEKDGGNNNKL